MPRKDWIDASSRDIANRIIANAIVKAEPDVLRSLLCQATDHPPVVHCCFGELTCARCSSRVGDMLTSGDNAHGRAIVGHNCKECRDVWNGLTTEQRLLMPADVVAAFNAPELEVAKV